MPFNISCKGDIAYDVDEPHDDIVETSSEGILGGTQDETASDGIQDSTHDDGKSLGEKLCGTIVSIYICMLWRV